MNKVIEVKKLSKNYEKNCVLNAISFYIEPNKIYGLLGPNGAGKSTIIKILVNEIAKTNGTIKYKDNLKIMYLEDVPKFYEFYSIEEYLTFIYKLEHNKKNTSKVDKVLEQVGLSKQKNEKVSSISRGLRQRLGIAAAIINQPDVLILDEPVSALDPIGRLDIFELLNVLKDEMAIIFSTHILSDVERICDHIILLNEGEVIVNLPIAEIVPKEQYIIIDFLDKKDLEKFEAHSEFNYIHIGAQKIKIKSEKIIEAQNSVLKHIVQHNISIKSINIKNETLEDIFVSKVGKYE